MSPKPPDTLQGRPFRWSTRISVLLRQVERHRTALPGRETVGTKAWIRYRNPVQAAGHQGVPRRVHPALRPSVLI